MQAPETDENPVPDESHAATGKLRNQNVSKIFRLLRGEDGSWGWSQVDVADYKPRGDSWRGVTRRVFVGERGESPDFHLRYFEIARGGYTTLERHQHEHAITVLRGSGQVLLGCETRNVGFGDVVYVAPDTSHQFRNDAGDEPFGFICVVNAVRDRPTAADQGACAICE